jgi:hypothetical protein
MPKECYREILNQSDTEEIRLGRAWYKNAKNEIEKIAADTLIPLETCAGVVACLSPMVEWRLNLRAAKRFLKTKGKSKGPGFAYNYRKAREVLRGDYSVIRGPKVSRFFKTLLNPAYPEAVIDSQMIDAWWGGEIDRGGVALVAGNEKRLQPIRQEVAELAKERGENVSQTQAILWLTHKRLKGKFANQYKLWKCGWHDRSVNILYTFMPNPCNGNGFLDCRGATSWRGVKHGAEGIKNPGRSATTSRPPTRQYIYGPGKANNVRGNSVQDFNFQNLK